MNRPVCVIAMSRSGTNYTAEVLRWLGLDVGHEHLEDDGAVGYNFLHPDLREGHEWRAVLHQVRYPPHVIGSCFTHTESHWARIEQLVGPLPDDELRRSMYAWREWNRRCEVVGEWTYRVEDLDKEVIWKQFCRHLGMGVPDSFPDIPTDTNHRDHRDVTWADMRQHPQLMDDIIDMAESYGYQDLPERDGRTQFSRQ